MAIRSRIMLALTLVAGLVGAGGLLLAPRPSAARDCSYETTWFRTAQLETLRIDGEEIQIPHPVPEIWIRASSYEHLPRITRDPRRERWDCSWYFQPLTAKPDTKVQP